MKTINYTIFSLLLILVMSCSNNNSNSVSNDKNLLNGYVKVDGSSTVYPVTEAIAEEFRSVQPNVKVSIGISGTGGGFKKVFKRRDRY